ESVGGRHLASAHGVGDGPPFQNEDTGPLATLSRGRRHRSLVVRPAAFRVGAGGDLVVLHGVHWIALRGRRHFNDQQREPVVPVSEVPAGPLLEQTSVYRRRP